MTIAWRMEIQPLGFHEGVDARRRVCYEGPRGIADARPIHGAFGCGTSAFVLFLLECQALLSLRLQPLNHALRNTYRPLKLVAQSINSFISFIFLLSLRAEFVCCLILLQAVFMRRLHLLALAERILVVHVSLEGDGQGLQVAPGRQVGRTRGELGLLVARHNSGSSCGRLDPMAAEYVSLGESLSSFAMFRPEGGWICLFFLNKTY